MAEIRSTIRQKVEIRRPVYSFWARCDPNVHCEPRFARPRPPFGGLRIASGTPINQMRAAFKGPESKRARQSPGKEHP